MRIIIILIFSLISLGAENPTPEIKAFLSNYCTDCHSNKKQKGKVNLEVLDGFTDLESVDLWLEVASQLKEKEMPPEDEKQPSDEERQKVIVEFMT